MPIPVCKIDIYKKIQNSQQSILETSDVSFAQYWTEFAARSGKADPRRPLTKDL